MSQLQTNDAAQTILIIDDNPINLRVLAENLQQHGYTVVVAQDGEEGFKRARLVKPDLILLDVMMPGINGLETCRRLKACDTTREIPVIFKTSLTDTAIKIAGFEAGGVDYVTSPLQIEEVMARVHTHLTLHTVQRRLEQARAELEDRVHQRTAELRAEVAERKRAEDAQRRLNRELQAISECNQTLLRATDEQTLVDAICRIICNEAGYSSAWVGYAEQDAARTVRPVAWAGIEERDVRTATISWSEERDSGRGPTGNAIRSGKPWYNQDFACETPNSVWQGLLQRGYRSGISLPLKDEIARTFGALTIYCSEPNAFHPEEIRLLEELAGDLAYGIITLRTRAERQRAEQEVALLRFALDNVRESAFLIGEDARFHYVNEEACRALGYTREEVLGKDVPEINPVFPAESWPSYWADLKSSRSLTFEGQHRAKDGHVFPVEINTNYFEYGGKPYNLALVRDITERKQAEVVMLEARVAERTRIARDLHDTLLQSFQALLPRIQTAIYKLPEGAGDARRTLEQAINQASEAIAEARDAVQGLRMSMVENDDLAVAIRAIGEEFASAENNDQSPIFRVVVEGTSRNLHPILRDEAYRVAAEALRNAFRHASARHVEVEIRYEEDYFQVRVRDDGKGIQPDVLGRDGRERHYGLDGMRERAKLAGGNLTIRSQVDSGTEIELTLPASKAY